MDRSGSKQTGLSLSSTVVSSTFSTGAYFDFLLHFAGETSNQKGTSKLNHKPSQPNCVLGGTNSIVLNSKNERKEVCRREYQGYVQCYFPHSEA